MPPALIAMGVPVHSAIGTSKAANIGQAMASFLILKKAKKIQWSYVPFLTVLAIVGSAIGSLIAVNIAPEALYPLVGVALCGVSVFMLLYRVDDTRSGRKHMRLGYGLYFLVAVYTGFFGPGAGMFVKAIMMRCFRLSPIETLGTDIIPWFCLTLVSVGIFAYHGHVHVELLAVLFPAMFIGAWGGTRIGLTLSHERLKAFICFFGLIMGISFLLR